jgi:hypothetical protein
VAWIDTVTAGPPFHEMRVKLRLVRGVRLEPRHTLGRRIDMGVGDVATGGRAGHATRAEDGSCRMTSMGWSSWVPAATSWRPTHSTWVDRRRASNVIDLARGAIETYAQVADSIPVEASLRSPFGTEFKTSRSVIRNSFDVQKKSP